MVRLPFVADKSPMSKPMTSSLNTIVAVNAVVPSWVAGAVISGDTRTLRIRLAGSEFALPSLTVKPIAA